MNADVTEYQSSLEQHNMRSGAQARQTKVSYFELTGALPPAPPSRLREAGTDEFVHSLTDILGGICRAGFSIEDFFEPNEGDQEAVRGSFTHRAAFLPPYIRILARKYGQRATLQPVVVQ